jgi:predicted DNA-binding transcriptional regulator AlpA
MAKATDLPDVGFARLTTVLAVYPVGRSTWWQGVRDGKFPKPIRLGARAVGWDVREIRELIERTAANAGLT